MLNPLPTQLAGIPAVSHPSELGAVDAVLICLPTELVVRSLPPELLRHHTPIVEAATLDGVVRQEHWQAIDRMALRRGVPAAVGAGWDPGIRPLFEGLFASLCPKGGTRIHDRPGVSLHHTLAAQAIPGVRDGLCAEMRGANGAVQRYVYVELTPGADLEPAAEAIRSDPLFLDEETLVLPVGSVATLEEEGHGLVIERWGNAGGKDHQRFLLGGGSTPSLSRARRWFPRRGHWRCCDRVRTRWTRFRQPACTRNRSARTPRRSSSARANESV